MKSRLSCLGMGIKNTCSALQNLVLKVAQLSLGKMGVQIDPLALTEQDTSRLWAFAPKIMFLIQFIPNLACQCCRHPRTHKTAFQSTVQLDSQLSKKNQNDESSGPPPRLITFDRPSIQSCPTNLTQASRFYSYRFHCNFHRRIFSQSDESEA